MSVISRVQWQDVPPRGISKYLDDSRTAFSMWATNDKQTSLPDGHSEQAMKDRRRVISLRTVEGKILGISSGLTGLEGVAWDTMDDGTRWGVVVRVVGNDDNVDVSVENRMESSDPTRPIRIGRPRVVDDLLACAGQPTLGGLPVETEEVEMPSGAIEAFINDTLKSPERRLPAIVCTQPDHNDGGAWVKNAGKIAKRTRGFANLFMLDHDATKVFRSHLDDLGAWNGCVRVYAPSPLAQQSDGWRHRYFLLNRFQPNPRPGIDRVVEAAAVLSARSRTAQALALFSAPTQWSAGTSTQPSCFDEESERAAQALIDSLSEEIQERDDEVNRLRGHLARIRRTLDDAGKPEYYWGAKDDPGTEMPDTVQDIEEAVLAAQTYLSKFLCLPEEAARDLDRLLTVPQAGTWGKAAWRALRALSAYSEHLHRKDFSGGFWEWCSQGYPESWPATDKKLSMTESESVKNNPTFNAQRLLPISADVRGDKKIHMYSHIKIAEGGGDLAPRIYFYDDTKGSTKKVHVGFIGPHYLMQNTRS